MDDMQENANSDTFMAEFKEALERVLLFAGKNLYTPLAYEALYNIYRYAELRDAKNAAYVWGEMTREDIRRIKASGSEKEQDLLKEIKANPATILLDNGSMLYLL
jgi:hypothetical protein